MGLFSLKDSYTLIAKNATKCYLELTRNHSNRFTDEVSLLATTAALDAQVYILEDSIKLDTIIRIARLAVGENKKEPTTYQLLEWEDQKANAEKNIGFAYTGTEYNNNPLFNTVFSLEVEIFAVDTKLHRSDIENSCYIAAPKIYKMISKTIRTYKSDKVFAKAANMFMDHTNFELWRRQIGIKD